MPCLSQLKWCMIWIIFAILSKFCHSSLTFLFTENVEKIKPFFAQSDCGGVLGAAPSAAVWAPTGFFSGGGGQIQRCKKVDDFSFLIVTLKTQVSTVTTNAQNTLQYFRGVQVPSKHFIFSKGVPVFVEYSTMWCDGAPCGTMAQWPGPSLVYRRLDAFLLFEQNIYYIYACDEKWHRAVAIHEVKSSDSAAHVTSRVNIPSLVHDYDLNLCHLTLISACRARSCTLQPFCTVLTQPHCMIWYRSFTVTS